MTTPISTVLNVSGMTCGKCVRHVSDALRELQGVENVDVSLNDAQAVVRHDPAAAPIATLIAAVSDAGYDATKRD